MRIASVLGLILIVAATAAAQDQQQQQPLRDDPQQIDCRSASTDARCGDEREPFIASIYVGEVIDTFAGDETLDYLNPEASEKSTLRAVGGVDFQYRLRNSANMRHQFWVYGETVHGVRSRDVDCNNPNTVQLSICSNNLSQDVIDDIRNGRTTDQFVAILRGATSLEAMMGMRYEFPPPLQKATDSPARLFAKLEFGFLTVSKGGGDVVDMHQIALGAIAINGKFRESYLQVGYGQNDLFLLNNEHRLKIDGYLNIDPFYIPMVEKLVDKPGSRITPFVQFIGDFDGGPHSDSIQTYFGINIAFGRKVASLAAANN